MFFEPNRTPYDWSFRLFGIRVRVHPLFWLGSAMLGWNSLHNGIEYLLLWMLAVLISILVHEFGHALAFRMFRVDSHIVLSLIAGLTVPYSSLAGRWRRIFVSLAGPAAGLCLAGLVFGVALVLPDGMPLQLMKFLRYLLFINLVWTLFNLLPVWPLDGGQVTREVCGMVWWRHGRRISLEISLVVAGLITVYSLACEFGWMDNLLGQLPIWVPPGTVMTAILFGLLAFQSFQLLQTDDWAESRWQR